jgi:hypothetical protein
MGEVTVQSLEQLLENSSATEPFKDAVRQYAKDRPHNLIGADRWQPQVKVLRVISKMLETFPEKAFERIDIDAVSGCSDYRGTVTIMPSDMTVCFEWNCAWKAEEMGWFNAFKIPDQIRAANECGYQCFKKFTVLEHAEECV